MILRITLLFLFALITLWGGSHVSAQTDEWSEALIALNDPGLTSVYEAGLVTPLDSTQTKDDFTVTLLWGYADAARMNIGLRIDIPDALVQQLSDIPDADLYSTLILNDTMVVDEDGNTYPFAWGSGGVIKAGETGALYNINYQMTTKHTRTDTLDLTLVGTVVMSYVTNHTTKEAETIVSNRPFSFDLKLVYQGGYSLTGDEGDLPLPPVTDSEIRVSLTKFTVAPSFAQLEYCMEVPFALGGDYYWGLNYTLAFNGDEDVVTGIPGGGGGGGWGDNSEFIMQCNSSEFYVLDTDTLAGEWSFQAKHAMGNRMGPPPPAIEKQLIDGVPFEDLKPQLIESGYLIEVEGNWGFTFHFEDPQ